MMNRLSIALTFIAVNLMGGCCKAVSDERPPASIPIYPGAKLVMANKTNDIGKFQYHTTDEGQKVRDWYSAQFTAQWTDRCGDWTKSTEMLGMQIDHRCFKSKGSDGFFRVEIGDNPSKPPRVISIQHCPEDRPDRCEHKP